MRDPRIRFNPDFVGYERDQPESKIRFLNAVSSYGFLSVVDEILKDPTIKPEHINKTLENAANSGHYAIVKRLIEDTRYQPNTDTLVAIIENSCHNGNSKTFDYFLQQLKEATCDNTPFFSQYQFRNMLNYAFHGQFKEIVWRLLQLSKRKGQYLPEVIDRQWIDIVQRILQEWNVDPSVNDNAALKHAVLIPNLEIVDLLLKHPRIDPRSLHFDKELQPTVVARLLKDPRISEDLRHPDKKRQRRE
eukprot:TRINITY_DN7011_c0_g1_i1.p1 TRINITY_DN7011_c0_g1~~TRINITY_DN7011_c0_g1_i1.p1  ORF type:complete len:290 (-),score=39.00 TRINITY_DN7011_c0_g1_i1:44-784(-)